MRPLVDRACSGDEVVAVLLGGHATGKSHMLYGDWGYDNAREIGAAPNLARWILERPAVALACAFGQAHAPLFRLDGPFADAAAADVCATELLEPIRKRGAAMNCIFGLTLCFFAVVNACAVVIEGVVESLFPHE